MKYQSSTVNKLTAIGQKIEQAGLPLLYLSLGVIYIWFGGIKFSAGQAEGMFGMIIPINIKM